MYFINIDENQAESELV